MQQENPLKRGLQFKDKQGRTWQLHREGTVRGGWECFEVLSGRYDDGLGRWVQRLGSTPQWFADNEILKQIAVVVN